MRIVIDLQGAQSNGSRNRGIGRYTMSLALAMVRNRGEHEIIIALNGLFPETIEPIRADFEGFLPQEQIRIWHAPGPVNQSSEQHDWNRQAAELVREAFLASLEPDVVVVSSLFEGLSDDAVTSIGSLTSKVLTAVILFDLIPLIHRSPYLENPAVAGWYDGKIGHIRRADLLLSISESARQEGIQNLNFPPSQVCNISTAADPQFFRKKYTIDQKEELLLRYGLVGDFIMYTGGIDYRKNIEGLIRAYASLPSSLRKNNQLAIVCAVADSERSRLEKIADELKLKKESLVLTGYVAEDDLIGLYSLCKVFVFPSKHEGFGLPALEAMCCGSAVIGSNTSSIPEVIGYEDALFDPYSDSSIANKLKQVLTDDDFRRKLELHGRAQAKLFSWDKCAQLGIGALESLISNKELTNKIVCKPVQRPRLAYVSPLPPERSGISDYSAEMLPELSRHYQIDVIVEQGNISDPWVTANCAVRSIEWFKSNSANFDRVLYHFGNSPFHQHMFDLIRVVPGVVVLHDFFLSSVLSHLDFLSITKDGFLGELYNSHGYKPVHEVGIANNLNDIAFKYPCNFSVLNAAQGVIVHSEFPRQLAKSYYTSNVADNWAVIPLLRVPLVESDRATARDILKLNADDFVICSFGLLGPTKLNDRLLLSWLASGLAKNKHCVLIFVGESQKDEYGQKLLTIIRRSGLSNRIRITGWVDTETYSHYLAAADIGVQLRTLSRGETSAAVLDCMNYGLATIVNSNGSMGSLPEDRCLKLPDEFTNVELSNALENLWQNKSLRYQLGKIAQISIQKEHAPRLCADQYFIAIEKFENTRRVGLHSLLEEISKLPIELNNNGKLVPLAESIADTFSFQSPQRQLFLDISVLVQNDARTGIQRVVRTILKHLVTSPPDGYRVEPVYATTSEGYRYARNFTFEFLGCSSIGLNDDFIEYGPKDDFLGLDLAHHAVISNRYFFRKMRMKGVKVKFVIYDLLCITMPEYFNFGEDAGELHAKWMSVVSESDGAICISRSVADEACEWLGENSSNRSKHFSLNSFHLGADIQSSLPSLGLPADAVHVLNKLNSRPTFLMVGTLEPRKGHAQAIKAFEELWEQGVDVVLVIVGKEGWGLSEQIEGLKSSPEIGQRLFWLDGISDEYLEKVYLVSKCLISASEGEGFGLPLIEAAQKGLPIIARDIPVFREVAGDNAFYFSGTAPSSLATVIQDWLVLYEKNQHPNSNSMPWLTWSESAEQLLEAIGITASEAKEEVITI